MRRPVPGAETVSPHETVHLLGGLRQYAKSKPS
jgi:hypothetical protein